jgi:hypothetical protein
MTLFEFLSIGVSLVLGLGVTLLLTSLLAAFRARRRMRADWMPFVWAAYVLALQAQYWWGSWSLVDRPEWTVVSFGIPLLLACLLFVAAGLVLPSGPGEYPADLREYFEQDGKYAVVALAARGAVAVGANVTVVGEAVLTPLHFAIAAQVAAALLFVFAHTRRRRAWATLLYGIAVSASVIMATQFAY